MLKLLAPLVARFGLAAVPGANIVAAIGSALSAAISFFSTPVGRMVGAAILCAGSYVFGDVHRGRLDAARYAAKWETAVRQAEAARAARDENIRRQVSTIADQRIAAIQRESEQLQSKVADYEQALSAQSGVACRVSPDDARRLRELGYGPAGAGRGAGGVRPNLAGGRPALGQGW